MGNRISYINECKMKIAVFLLALALSYVSADVLPEIYDAPEVELLTTESQVQSLMDAVKHLRAHTPARYAHHVATVSKHAAIMDESSKTKAYVHNFRSTQAAIRAALKTLNDELLAGHKHDESVLRNAKASHVNAVSGTVSGAKSKVKSYKHKGCPTKRNEENANEKKMKAKAKRDALGKGKICPLNTTWGDMDVEKAVPKYGSELRNAWDKKRAEWLKHHNAYTAAATAHSNAKTKHDKVMASFRTALNLEASNAKTACDNANGEFETLKRDVASNVATRKQVHISSLVVKCYVDHMTSNSAAKACADRARKANVSIWDINGGALPACSSKAAYANSFGPSGWRATKDNCAPHRAEVSQKERAKKEKANKKKEKDEKAREERKNKAIEKDEKAKEKVAKEKKAKADERNKKAKERNDKHHEKQSKENHTKATERNNKAAAAERKTKADERERKRRAAGTCTVWAYDGNNYSGALQQQHSVCNPHRQDIRYSTKGRRRGFLASSFKLSSGCKKVQLWDEDACRYNYGHNQNIHHSVASVVYDLNDDVCGISVWSKC